MKKLAITVFMAALAMVASDGAWAKKKAATRAPSSEQKYCGTWVVGPNGYHTNYDHFKPTTLLGTVKDGKFNVQVLAKTEGGSWDILQDIDRGRCICVKGERKGHIMKSTSGIFECNGGAEITPQDHSGGEGENN